MTPGPDPVPPVAVAAPHRSSLVRNAFFLLVGQVATTALSIVVSGALARTLGTADFGLFYLIGTMSSFAYVFVDWGHAAYMMLEISRRREKAGALLGTAIAIDLAAVVLVTALTAVVATLLGYDTRTRGFALIQIAVALPLFLAQTYSIVFRAYERMEFDALVTIAAKIGVVALTLPLLAAGGRLMAALSAQAVAGIAALAVAHVVYRRIRAQPLSASIPWARELLVCGTPFVAMTFALLGQTYIEAIVLSKLVPAPVVGWYGASKNIINTLMAPAAILGSASLPRLSRASGDPREFGREMDTAMRPLLWLGSLGSVGAFLFAEVAISVVYGREKFAPSIAILRVFSPALLLLFMDTVGGYGVSAIGRMKQLTVLKLVAVAVCTGLDLLLVPWFQARYGNGGLGLVVAYCIAEALMVAGTLFLFPKGTLNRAMLVDLGRALLTAAATLGLFALLPPLPPLVAIPLCIAAFTAVSIGVGLVQRSDLEKLRAIVQRRLQR